jgi:hypothetical protein
VIVDGSNIATEGRDTPSLAQLDEAVQAFIREYEPEIVTVVVDATFPNRIARSERKIYEDAIDAGELITPPAGAIGRGDAFILQIADRADATILSNDSFQEFHGEYEWLFDEGRLIGGKPVPHVGWVFMPRTPVRGPASRRAVNAARRTQPASKPSEAAAPTTAAEPAKRSRRATKQAAKPAKAEAKPSVRAAKPAPTPTPAKAAAAAPKPAAPPAPVVGPEVVNTTAYNEALPFIEFVGEHPVGSEVEAVVEHFGSHGAYLRIGDVRAYAPLKNLADPAPRSAKEVLRVGETRRFAVASIDPPRRGVDLALPGMIGAKTQAPAPASAPAPAAADSEKPTQPRRSRNAKKAVTAKKTPAKKAAAKKVPAARAVSKRASAKNAPTDKRG